MDLTNSLLTDRSLDNKDRIVAWTGNNASRFSKLFELLYSNDAVLVQRAVWPVSYAAVANPALVSNHYQQIIDLILDDQLHPAVRRCLMYVLSEVPFPEAFHGIIMDSCFNFINDPNEKVAVKSYAIGIIEDLAATYPEIMEELVISIETQMPHALPAFTSKGKKVLQRYYKKKRS